jgi:hypothetical protein
MEQQKGSAILVLANDAHSWPELYIEELGWVILDVAPQTVLDEMGEGPDLQMLDALEELARAEPDSQFRRAINWKALWVEYRGYILNGLSFVVVVLFVGLWTRKARRRWMYRSNPSTYWVYVSALDALSEQGLIRHKGESPEHFARRIQPDHPSFTPIVWAHIGMVFGEKVGDVDALTAHRQMLSTEIASQTSGWRWLGWVNPFSPWASR